MSARRFVSSTLLLLATLSISGLATAATSSEPSFSPAPIPASSIDAAASPSPGPSASEPASPVADPSPSADSGLCALFENADVAGFLGAELISVTELPAQGAVIGGCAAIATNSVSLTLRLLEASAWEEHITSFGNEPVPDLPDAYFSDIVGLSLLSPSGETYIGVQLRPGFGATDHLRAVGLLLVGSTESRLVELAS